MSEKNFPKISVIIPMYNSEKFIGECLDSVFVQTFQDFEIIVVDNCSTDKSCEVVENYVKNFGEKIKLIRKNFNSGSAGDSNNIGFKNSCGEYIFFMESDDLITKTAFEEFYNISEKFDTDVITFEKTYVVKGNGKISDLPIHIATPTKINCVNEPTWVSENISEKIKELGEYKFMWPVWTKFIKRDCILENNLEWINVLHFDLIYTTCLICAAKKILRVPNIININRLRDDSLSHKQEDIEKTIIGKFGTLIRGVEYMDKFFDNLEDFKNRKDLKYMAFDVVVKDMTNFLLEIYTKVPAYQIDEILRNELGRVGKV
ncbi:MAG: glycosyltransferase [Selenomonadaceae bacterium]|nr:glycosyltransferase [Selenomonadaceae bacterium]